MTWNGLDPLVVDVDEADIVEHLQPEVRRVVVDAAALVTTELVEKALEGRPVEYVVARAAVPAKSWQ